jgi:hypothetical protein
MRARIALPGRLHFTALTGFGTYVCRFVCIIIMMPVRTSYVFTYIFHSLAGISVYLCMYVECLYSCVYVSMTNGVSVYVCIDICMMYVCLHVSLMYMIYIFVCTFLP